MEKRRNFENLISAKWKGSYPNNAWIYFYIINFSDLPFLYLKGVTGNVWWLKWECSIVEKFVRNHLRPIRRFYGAYLLSKSANSNIRIDCSFWRDDFENRFIKKYSITTTKNVEKILQYTKELSFCYKLWCSNPLPSYVVDLSYFKL